MEEDSPEGWFYLGTDGTENGPLNFRIIRAHLRLGTLPADIPVWREGLRDWTEAQHISLFRNMGGQGAALNAPSSPLVEETVKGVANGIYDAKTNYVTDGGTPLFPSTPERRFLLHQDRHDGKKVPTSTSSSSSRWAAASSRGQAGGPKGGEWFYCSRENKEPRGPVSTDKVAELSRKGILTAQHWVWSEQEQPFWIKFSECARFRDLLARQPSPRQPSAGRPPRQTASSRQPPASEPGTGVRGAPRRGARHKRTRRREKRQDAAATPAPPAGQQEANGDMAGLFEDLRAFERESAEVEAVARAREEAGRVEEKSAAKIRDYKGKLRLLREELRIRDEQIAALGAANGAGRGSDGGGKVDEALRARLEVAEQKLRDQNAALARKEEDIKRLEVTVAETDSELTKARIALSKELSWLLEETAQ